MPRLLRDVAKEGEKVGQLPVSILIKDHLDQLIWTQLLCEARVQKPGCPLIRARRISPASRHSRIEDAPQEDVHGLTTYLRVRSGRVERNRDGTILVLLLVGWAGILVWGAAEVEFQSVQEVGFAGPGRGQGGELRDESPILSVGR